MPAPITTVKGGTVKEFSVEEHLRRRVKAMGGRAVKLSPEGNVGIQDRMVVLPGRLIFIELKRPKGGRLAPLQQWWRDMLLSAGAEVHVCNTIAAVDRVLDGT